MEVGNGGLRGAKIAICARNGAELKRAKKDLERFDAPILDVVGDVRNQNKVNRMIETVCNHYGQIDVLINNARVIQVGPLKVQTKKDFEDAMNVHFWSAYYTMSALFPELTAKITCSTKIAHRLFHHRFRRLWLIKNRIEITS